MSDNRFYSAEPIGVCVSMARCIQYSDEDGETKTVKISTTLPRTFSYLPVQDGKSYEVYCPELGKFGQLYLTEEEFGQFAILGLAANDWEIPANYAPDRAKREKHFRLSTHRGGKRRVEHIEEGDNDDSSE